MELHEHEMASQKRFEKLHEAIKENGMSERTYWGEPQNNSGSNGLAGGLGGGLVGGFVGSMVNGGGFGGNRQEYVTPQQLQASTQSIIDTTQNTTMLQTLGQVEASILASESRLMQSAATSDAALRTHLGQVENTLDSGHAAINKAVSDSLAATLQSQNAVNMNVMQQGSNTRELINAMGQANLAATKDAQFATQLAIAAGNKEILAALNAQNEAGLRSEITALQIRLSEQQAESRARGTEVNVTQTVNQNQMQLQAQAQAQAQLQLLYGINSALNGLQSAVSTNSSLIVGNSGAVTSGAQTSNPVNVRT